MPNKAILITGASSGIGKTTALSLARSGMTVYAGALNDAEATALERDAISIGSDRLRPIVLDVTSQPSIDAAMARISAECGPDGLAGLVSNAGVNFNGPLAYLTDTEIRAMIEVNFAGPIFLVRAAIPLLRQSKGRLVMVSSATAHMPPPTIQVYGATKCGVSGFADSMRLELGMAGVSVSLVEPGVIRTPMTRLAPDILNRVMDRMSDDDRSLYGRVMRKIVDMSAPEKVGSQPEKVTAAIHHALTAKRPQSRYRVGADCKATGILRHLPDGLRDGLQRKIFGIAR